MAITIIRMAHMEEEEEATELRCTAAGELVGERLRADKEAAEWAVDVGLEAAIEGSSFESN